MKFFNRRGFIPLGALVLLVLAAVLPVLVVSVQQRQELRKMASTASDAGDRAWAEAKLSGKSDAEARAAAENAYNRAPAPTAVEHARDAAADAGRVAEIAKQGGDTSKMTAIQVQTVQQAGQDAANKVAPPPAVTTTTAPPAPDGVFKCPGPQCDQCCKPGWVPGCAAMGYPTRESCNPASSPQQVPGQVCSVKGATCQQKDYPETCTTADKKPGVHICSKKGICTGVGGGEQCGGGSGVITWSCGDCVPESQSDTAKSPTAGIIWSPTAVKAGCVDSQGKPVTGSMVFTDGDVYNCGTQEKVFSPPANYTPEKVIVSDFCKGGSKNISDGYGNFYDCKSGTVTNIAPVSQPGLVIPPATVTAADVKKACGERKTGMTGFGDLPDYVFDCGAADRNELRKVGKAEYLEAVQNGEIAQKCTQTSRDGDKEYINKDCSKKLTAIMAQLKDEEIKTVARDYVKKTTDCMKKGGTAACEDQMNALVNSTLGRGFIIETIVAAKGGVIIRDDYLAKIAAETKKPLADINKGMEAVVAQQAVNKICAGYFENGTQTEIDNCLKSQPVKDETARTMKNVDYVAGLAEASYKIVSTRCQGQTDSDLRVCLSFSGVPLLGEPTGQEVAISRVKEVCSSDKNLTDVTIVGPDGQDYKCAGGSQPTVSGPRKPGDTVLESYLTNSKPKIFQVPAVVPPAVVPAGGTPTKPQRNFGDLSNPPPTEIPTEPGSSVPKTDLTVKVNCVPPPEVLVGGEGEIRAFCSQAERQLIAGGVKIQDDKTFGKLAFAGDAQSVIAKFGVAAETPLRPYIVNLVSYREPEVVFSSNIPGRDFNSAAATEYCRANRYATFINNYETVKATGGFNRGEKTPTTDYYKCDVESPGNYILVGRDRAALEQSLKPTERIVSGAEGAGSQPVFAGLYVKDSETVVLPDGREVSKNLLKTLEGAGARPFSSEQFVNEPLTGSNFIQKISFGFLSLMMGRAGPSAVDDLLSGLSGTLPECSRQDKISAGSDCEKVVKNVADQVEQLGWDPSAKKTNCDGELKKGTVESLTTPQCEALTDFVSKQTSGQARFNRSLGDVTQINTPIGAVPVTPPKESSALEGILKFGANFGTNAFVVGGGIMALNAASPAMAVHAVPVVGGVTSGVFVANSVSNVMHNQQAREDVAAIYGLPCLIDGTGLNDARFRCDENPNPYANWAEGLTGKGSVETEKRWQALNEKIIDDLFNEDLADSQSFNVFFKNKADSNLRNALRQNTDCLNQEQSFKNCLSPSDWEGLQKFYLAYLDTRGKVANGLKGVSVAGTTLALNQEQDAYIKQAVSDIAMNVVFQAPILREGKFALAGTKPEAKGFVAKVLAPLRPGSGFYTQGTDSVMDLVFKTAIGRPLGWAKDRAFDGLHAVAPDRVGPTKLPVEPTLLEINQVGKSLNLDVNSVNYALTGDTRPEILVRLKKIVSPRVEAQGKKNNWPSWYVNEQIDQAVERAAQKLNVDARLAQLGSRPVPVIGPETIVPPRPNPLVQFGDQAKNLADRFFGWLDSRVNPSRAPSTPPAPAPTSVPAARPAARPIAVYGETGRTNINIIRNQITNQPTQIFRETRFDPATGQWSPWREIPITDANRFLVADTTRRIAVEPRSSVPVTPAPIVSRPPQSPPPEVLPPPNVPLRAGGPLGLSTGPNSEAEFISRNFVVPTRSSIQTEANRLLSLPNADPATVRAGLEAHIDAQLRGADLANDWLGLKSRQARAMLRNDPIINSTIDQAVTRAPAPSQPGVVPTGAVRNVAAGDTIVLANMRSVPLRGDTLVLETGADGAIIGQPTRISDLGGKFDPSKYLVRQIDSRTATEVYLPISKEPLVSKGNFVTDQGTRGANEDTALSFEGWVAGGGTEKGMDAGTIARLSGERGQLHLVSDGIGGAVDGEVASAMTKNGVFKHYYDPTVKKIDANGSFDPTAQLKYAVEQANAEVFTAKQAARNDMGATVVAVVVKGDTAVFANVGDSRGYLWSQGGARKVTKDHSLVQSLVDSGQITELERVVSPQRNFILRNVGDKQSIAVDIFTERIQPGDRVVLVTDGVWEYYGSKAGKVPDNVLPELRAEDGPHYFVTASDTFDRSLGDLAGRGKVEDLPGAIIGKTKAPGGYLDDNVTVLAVEIKPNPVFDQSAAPILVQGLSVPLVITKGKVLPVEGPIGTVSVLQGAHIAYKRPDGLVVTTNYTGGSDVVIPAGATNITISQGRGAGVRYAVVTEKLPTALAPAAQPAGGGYYKAPVVMGKGEVAVVRSGTIIEPTGGRRVVITDQTLVAAVGTDGRFIPDWRGETGIGASRELQLDGVKTLFINEPGTKVLKIDVAGTKITQPDLAKLNAGITPQDVVSGLLRLVGQGKRADQLEGVSLMAEAKKLTARVTQGKGDAWLKTDFRENQGVPGIILEAKIETDLAGADRVQPKRVLVADATVPGGVKGDWATDTSGLVNGKKVVAVLPDNQRVEPQTFWTSRANDVPQTKRQWLIRKVTEKPESLITQNDVVAALAENRMRNVPSVTGDLAVVTSDQWQNGVMVVTREGNIKKIRVLSGPDQVYLDGLASNPGEKIVGRVMPEMEKQAEILVKEAGGRVVPAVGRIRTEMVLSEIPQKTRDVFNPLLNGLRTDSEPVTIVEAIGQREVIRQRSIDAYDLEVSRINGDMTIPRAVRDQMVRDLTTIRDAYVDNVLMARVDPRTTEGAVKTGGIKIEKRYATAGENLVSYEEVRTGESSPLFNELGLDTKLMPNGNVRLINTSTKEIAIYFPAEGEKGINSIVKGGFLDIELGRAFTVQSGDIRDPFVYVAGEIELPGFRLNRVGSPLPLDTKLTMPWQASTVKEHADRRVVWRFAKDDQASGWGKWKKIIGTEPDDYQQTFRLGQRRLEQLSLEEGGRADRVVARFQRENPDGFAILEGKKAVPVWSVGGKDIDAVSGLLQAGEVVVDGRNLVPRVEGENGVTAGLTRLARQKENWPSVKTQTQEMVKKVEENKEIISRIEQSVEEITNITFDSRKRARNYAEYVIRQQLEDLGLDENVIRQLTRELGDWRVVDYVDADGRVRINLWSDDDWITLESEKRALQNVLEDGYLSKRYLPEELDWGDAGKKYLLAETVEPAGLTAKEMGVLTGQQRFDSKVVAETLGKFRVRPETQVMRIETKNRAKILELWEEHIEGRITAKYGKKFDILNLKLGELTEEMIYNPVGKDIETRAKIVKPKNNAGDLNIMGGGASNLADERYLSLAEVTVKGINLGGPKEALEPDFIYKEMTEFLGGTWDTASMPSKVLQMALANGDEVIIVTKGGVPEPILKSKMQEKFDKYYNAIVKAKGKAMTGDHYAIPDPYSGAYQALVDITYYTRVAFEKDYGLQLEIANSAKTYRPKVWDIIDSYGLEQYPKRLNAPEKGVTQFFHKIQSGLQRPVAIFLNEAQIMNGGKTGIGKRSQFLTLTEKGKFSPQLSKTNSGGLYLGGLGFDFNLNKAIDAQLPPKVHTRLNPALKITNNILLGLPQAYNWELPLAVPRDLFNLLRNDPSYTGTLLKIAMPRLYPAGTAGRIIVGAATVYTFNAGTELAINNVLCGSISPVAWVGKNLPGVGGDWNANCLKDKGVSVNVVGWAVSGASDLAGQTYKTFPVNIKCWLKSSGVGGLLPAVNQPEIVEKSGPGCVCNKDGEIVCPPPANTPPKGFLENPLPDSDAPVVGSTTVTGESGAGGGGTGAVATAMAVVEELAKNQKYAFLKQIDVLGISKTTGVPAALLLGQMRQESSFQPNAVRLNSQFGLMQMTQVSATETLNKLKKQKLITDADLKNKKWETDPKLNALMGSFYLQDLKKQIHNGFNLNGKVFNENTEWDLALLAYNKGIGNMLASLRACEKKCTTTNQVLGKMKVVMEAKYDKQTAASYLQLATTYVKNIEKYEQIFSSVLEVQREVKAKRL